MTRRRSGEGSRGVVLIEALASLVIVAMIALMLTAGIATGRRIWERTDAREARTEAVYSVQAALRDEIEQIFPQTRSDRNPPYIDFQGSLDHVDFLSSPSRAQRPAPLRRYTLSVTPRGQLVLASVSDTAPDGTGPTDKRVLLSGVRGLELGYFGPVFPDEQLRWRRLWQDEADLPQIVRVRVAFAPGDPRVWPDLLVRPRATIDSQCMINPVTHRCKGRV